MKKRVVLITGGARSGKSGHALELARGRGNKAFIATGEPVDEEMRGRIAAHRKERKGAFLTIEEPLDPGSALRSLPDEIEIAVVDCLTTWAGNLMHHRGTIDLEGDEVRGFLEIMRDPPCELVVVTNEVGMGIVPERPEVRLFRDLAGRLNGKAAHVADEVVLMMSGIPLYLKETRR